MFLAPAGFNEGDVVFGLRGMALMEETPPSQEDGRCETVMRL